VFLLGVPCSRYVPLDGAAVAFGQFLKIISRSGATIYLFHSTSFVLILGKTGSGYILSDFFTNTSSHLGPVSGRTDWANFRNEVIAYHGWLN
jgi:hypothetical protein